MYVWPYLDLLEDGAAEAQVDPGVGGGVERGEQGQHRRQHAATVHWSKKMGRKGGSNLLDAKQSDQVNPTNLTLILSGTIRRRIRL